MIRDGAPLVRHIKSKHMIDNLRMINVRFILGNLFQRDFFLSELAYMNQSLIFAPILVFSSSHHTQFGSVNILDQHLKAVEGYNPICQLLFCLLSRIGSSFGSIVQSTERFMPN